MTQYTGQITVIIDTADEADAESRLRAIARHIDEEADDVVFADHNGDVEDYDAIEAECQKSLESGPTIPAKFPTRFDDYEIQPCRRYIDADQPGLSFVEPCETFEADFWTLYGHVCGEGVHAIGDFHDRKHAEEVYARITGLEFTGCGKADAHLRMMHAGPKLLKALVVCADLLGDYDESEGEEGDAYREAIAAIAEATGRAA